MKKSKKVPRWVFSLANYSVFRQYVSSENIYGYRTKAAAVRGAINHLRSKVDDYRLRAETYENLAEEWMKLIPGLKAQYKKVKVNAKRSKTARSANR